MSSYRCHQGRPNRAHRNRAGERFAAEPLESRVLLSAFHHPRHSGQPSIAVEPAVVPPTLNIATGTGGADTINLVRDGDGQHIDWSVNGGGVSSVAITD